MILLDNRTPLDAVTFDAKDLEEKPFQTVVVKGMFCIERDKPVVMEEGAQEKLIVDDDLVPFKLGTDVHVRATAYAPSGKATSWRAGISVGALKKYVTVTGPRAWMRAPLLGWSLTPPVAVNRVPLRYEFAYGGPGFARNPLGIGYVDPRKLTSDAVIAAPQILSDDGVPLVFGKDYPVETFLPVSEKWPPRGLAEGFEACHAAPPSLVTEGYLRGNEVVELLAMHPEHERFSFRLPNVLIAAAVTDRVGYRYGSPGRLDTVFVDMEAMRVMLAWRVVLPLYEDGAVCVDVAMRGRLE